MAAMEEDNLAAALEGAIEEAGDGIPPEMLLMSAADIRQRNALLQQEISFMVRESDRYRNEMRGLEAKAKENKEKIKLNKVLPYLVANVVEVRCGALPVLLSRPFSLRSRPPLRRRPPPSRQRARRAL
jgi:hypothetical protein